MTSKEKGGLLGVANVLVIALGVAVMEAGRSSDGVELFWLVAMVGMLPGIGTGIVLGALAGWLPRFRLPVLAGLALVVVVLLGETMGLSDLVVLAGIPTVVAASILERSTRRVDPPPIPPASVVVQAPGPGSLKSSSAPARAESCS